MCCSETKGCHLCEISCVYSGECVKISKIRPMNCGHFLLKRGSVEGHWNLSGVYSHSFHLFLYNSVLIACGLVVLEEGHRETVIHAECRLFMWLLWGHAQKTFSLPVTLHLLASQGKYDGNVLWFVSRAV